MEINRKKSRKGIKIIIFSLVVIAVVVSVFSLYNFQKDIVKSELLESDLIACADNCGYYIDCKAFQQSSEDYCEKAYDNFDISNEGIEGSRIGCLLLTKANEIIEGKNIEYCNGIILRENYDENIGEHRGLIEMCYILFSDSREICKGISITEKINGDFDILDNGWISFCDVFYDYFESGKRGEVFQDLDNADKNAIILMKALKLRDVNLCDEIIVDSREGLDAKRRQCRILLGDSEAQKDDFCEPLLENCYNSCFS